MSLLTRIYNTVKPPIINLIRLIDLIMMFITRTVSHTLLLGIKMVQEMNKMEGRDSFTNGLEIPTEEELADWSLSMEEIVTPQIINGRVEEEDHVGLLEERQLEQEIITATEAPHPHALGDHNNDELSQIALCEEVIVPELEDK
ncbi:hypothetical protein O3M35_009485 [Rhynocoris fuscipes]|uniref:Uncharacterized protein n=1 Tax=Rhynocoris fuscipes TaxID=488301 RepID=A0AAW1D3W8_9HEMI